MALDRCHCGTIIWRRGDKQCHICTLKGRFPNTGAQFIVCRWCLNAFLCTLSACPDCGTENDKTLNLEASMKRQKGYIDIVKDNARRDGKDVAAEVRKAEMANRHEFIGVQSSREVLKNINRSLRKHRGAVKAKPFGWESAAQKLPERPCLQCGNMYQPRIIGNRYGGQKYCARCRLFRRRERAKQQYRERIQDIKKPTP